jgi:putative ABC transport system substrate-binding protein
VADAVGAGLVTSLARPGGNITGVTSISAALGGKRLELLKGIVPKASRVAILYNPADQSNTLVWTGLQESSKPLGLALHPHPVRGPGDFEGAFAEMTRERAQALFVAAGVLTTEHRKFLVDLAATAAEVVRLTATLEGPDSPIDKALGPPSEADNDAGKKISSLADRVRALQKAAAAG